LPKKIGTKMMGEERFLPCWFAELAVFGAYNVKPRMMLSICNIWSWQATSNLPAMLQLFAVRAEG